MSHFNKHRRAFLIIHYVTRLPWFFTAFYLQYVAEQPRSAVAACLMIAMIIFDLVFPQFILLANARRLNATSPAQRLSPKQVRLRVFLSELLMLTIILALWK